METIQQVHERQKPDYEFTWNEDVVLLRDKYGDRNLEELVDGENTVRLWTIGGWFGTRGGEAEFFLLLQDENEPIGLAETRDFSEPDPQRMEEPVPLIGNARIVDIDHPLYTEIMRILVTMRS